MALRYRYKGIPRPQGMVKSPSIPIFLRGTGEPIEFIALLDSGADFSAIPQEVGELLGLNLKGKREPVKGIGGEVDSIETKVRITVGKGRETYHFLIPMKVLFTETDFGVLLGRASFFNKFIISFDEASEKMTLKRRYIR